ncbi:Leucine-rich repeat-containing protein 4C [Holothuria leucospilota]|uniref:Leucine-rich repeat-containing protein 4C n=1 Tax=Holothuria leucospilota TaxID=206669 RepID=A0A9Q1CJN5_HOLLE|nr:Leucine-rich repeat-containing protein 4C [Holothuria leucospilota]
MIVLVIGVVDESAAVPFDIISRLYNCNEVCDYDDWFHRAHCEERHFHQVPFSTGCTEAVMLEIQENNIERLTVECLIGYRKVRTLDASRNNISTIEPGTFFCTPRLRNLLIPHNKLSALVNGTFSGTENYLERIFLNHNELTYMDEDAFKHLTNVVFLQLGSNNIENLHPHIFQGMPKLRHLSLGKNKLKSIHQGIFDGLTMLESIDIRHNKLMEIPKGLFDGLTSLTEILLSRNDIVRLPIPSGLGSPRYQLFDIANNKINETGSILSYLEISDIVYIDGNPFNCDCNSLVLQRWYHNKSQSEQLHYKARNPIVCGRHKIDEDLNFTCEHTHAVKPNEGKVPNIDSTVDIPFISSSIAPEIVLITTSTIQTTAVDNQDSFFETKCHESSSSDLDDKILSLSIYIAVISTAFFLLWAVFTVKRCFKKNNRNRLEN